MVEFKVEYLRDCIEEMKPLLYDHYLEVHAYPDKIPFNPDYDRYLELEKSGVIHLTTARVDGKMVGST